MNIGQEMVAAHMAQMTGMSRQKWPPIVEEDGFEVVEDRAYQGFDDRPELGYPEPRFWCRSIRVRRVSDGVGGWSIGPQADAYRRAVANARKHADGLQDG